jgi:hypothetical protein
VRVASVALVLGVLAAGSVALAAVPADRAIDSGDGVQLIDYDGHPHRSAPKGIGQTINIWCRSTIDRLQHVFVNAFFDARLVNSRRIACPHGSTYRPHHIVRVSKVGVYGLVLSGGGFDSFVIRTRTHR